VNTKLNVYIPEPNGMAEHIGGGKNLSSSLGKSKLYAALFIVFVVAGAATVFLVMYKPAGPSGPSIQLIGSGNATRNVTLSEVQAMFLVSRYGSFQNSYGNVRGQGNYSGVKIADLVELVGGMQADQLLVVNASDGYSQTFSYRNVYPNATGWSIQGDMILAFEYNGTLVPTWEDGYRIVFMPEDGYFSNQDGALTIENEFYTGATGPKCVTNVASIQVTNREPSVLRVKVGDAIKSYTMTDILQLPNITGPAGYKKSSGNITGIGDYTGVPLLDLLSDVGPLPANYSIEMISSDDYTTFFNRSQVEGFFEGYNATTGESVGRVNCTLILAYLLDGTPLLVDSGPFRAATINQDGYVTDGHFWAKMIVNVTLVDEVEPWELGLDGVQSWNMTHDTYYSLASCEHHRKTITVGENYYWGVALWVLVSSMDGGDDTHYTFNVSLAIHGYNVTLYDGEGASIHFTAAQLADNNTLVVAGWVNGELLTHPQYPLVLVTPSGLLLENIVRIEMTGWQ